MLFIKGDLMGLLKKFFDSKIYLINFLVVLVVLFAGCILSNGDLTDPISSSGADVKLDLHNQNLPENTVVTNQNQIEYVENPAPSAIEIAENPVLLEDQEILVIEGELPLIEEDFLPENESEGLVEEDCSLIFDQSMKNNCLYDQAIKNEDISICEEIFDYMMQENCRIMANENPDCVAIIDSNLRNMCIVDQAVAKGEIELCNQIIDEFMKSNCVDGVENPIEAFDLNLSSEEF